MTVTTRHDPSHRTAAGGGLSPAPRRGTLSILVPAKNEAASLPRLVEEIVAAFRPLRDRASGPHPLEAFEILVIDDGSTDDSVAVLARLAAGTPELRPIRLVANAGQSAATACGFRAARGDWVAILDADLQNPPAELARLWDALPGHDAALGWRIKREDKWSKRVISRHANRVRNGVLGGQPIRDTGCAVRIFPREVALRFPMFHGAHRFYGPLLDREGCRIVQVPVEHRPRPYGTSNYNIWNRSLNVIVDLLGVAWLVRRSIRYQAEPVVAAEAAPSPHVPPSATARQGAGASATAPREV
jgi:glycosyltransferase involved in cell wall biosynthesis